MSDGNEADRSGILNPYKKRVSTGPTPPNQPENRTVDSTLQPGRYTVFPGQEHPRAATPDVYHEEDASQSNRHLTPETASIKVVKKGDTK